MKLPDGMLALLTKQIVAGEISVELARATVLTRKYCRQPERESLDDIIDNAILDAISRNGGSRRRAARDLGIGFSTVYRRMDARVKRFCTQA
jgi:DNA-binding NtrC family response regulator